ncbi:DUF1289 domain-containing protein [Burkholderia anthina]|uniref:DUF1289 domain-containing protein n=1 Tax=Burkholderia anthina TaxID=179879 RepID=UPI00075ACA8A|nr:DUF1289 domain-containing protein [Burkholderia anthina]KWH54750.1 hypothetical protein WT63_27445 [Burkholderia anthina]
MNEFNGSPPGGAHSHAFPGAVHARNERKTWLVIGLRTRDEARDWKKLTDHRRHQILNDRKRRQAKLQRETAE